MKVLSVQPFWSHRVETDRAEFPYLTRIGPDNWTQRMGESEEPLYDCEEAEVAYQAYRREHP